MSASVAQGVLRELEQKKPQLDELLHTAESLKGTENRQQLHGKVYSEYYCLVILESIKRSESVGSEGRAVSRRTSPAAPPDWKALRSSSPLLYTRPY
ncbi:hypothetical protein SFRURICE_010653 [Spodoptera frugiperda]|uniref:SFRICE_036521 n=1 Tax=Spodoptera frugiperda TaxID=7108 RepID=A0A2H1WVA1_SPOFR|nr:hypothetical protein SFRURICE_010653 [Spodoptera frugiperda]